MTQATAYFCPECGSPTIERSALVGGDASCKACTWKGKSADLLVHDFEHDLGSAEQAIQLYVRDIANVLAKTAALHLGRMLVKWGFLDAKSEKANQHLNIYLTEAARAVATSFVETREKIATGQYDAQPAAPESDKGDSRAN